LSKFTGQIAVYPLNPAAMSTLASSGILQTMMENLTIKESQSCCFHATTSTDAQILEMITPEHHVCCLLDIQQFMLIFWPAHTEHVNIVTFSGL
jgi:hypothetical protein